MLLPPETITLDADSGEAGREVPLGAEVDAFEVDSTVQETWIQARRVLVRPRFMGWRSGASLSVVRVDVYLECPVHSATWAVLVQRENIQRAEIDFGWTGVKDGGEERMSGDDSASRDGRGDEGKRHRFKWAVQHLVLPNWEVGV